jgi:hypothetical protein
VWRRMQYLTGMAAIGGFLFGYDTGVISGAMLPLRRAFHLTPYQQEVVVSSTVLSACLSSLFLGATMNDRLGRRWAILWSAAVFGVGSLVLMCAVDYVSLVVGRVILGLGIGVASLTTPVYIAEVAAPTMRGRLVTINTLMITFGQFFAGMIDGIFDSWMPETGWRYMLGLAVLPAAIMFVGFLNLPESPRWLAEKGYLQEAAVVLMELRETPDDAQIELTEIVQALPSGHRRRRRPPTRRLHDHQSRNDEYDCTPTCTVDETTSLASSSSNKSDEHSSSSLPYGSDTSLQSKDSFDHEPYDNDSNDYDIHDPRWDMSRVPLSFRTIGKNNNGDGPNDHDLLRSDGGGKSGSHPNSLLQLYTMLSHPPTRRALILGCGLMAIQQCSGVRTFCRFRRKFPKTVLLLYHACMHSHFFFVST